MPLGPVATCADLSMEHAASAARSFAAMRAFLSWAEKTARPGEGAPKILMAVACLLEAEWMDGLPYVEIEGDEAVTRLTIFVDHGFGVRERLFPVVVMPVPLDEWARAVRLAPKLAAPFVVSQRGDLLVLAAEELSEEPAEASPLEIDASSLSEPPMNEEEKKTAPPHRFSDKARPLPATPIVMPKPPSTPTFPKATPRLPVAGMPEPKIMQRGHDVHTHPTVQRMVAVNPEAFRNPPGGATPKAPPKSGTGLAVSGKPGEPRARLPLPSKAATSSTADEGPKVAKEEE